MYLAELLAKGKSVGKKLISANLSFSAKFVGKEKITQEKMAGEEKSSEKVQAKNFLLSGQPPLSPGWIFKGYSWTRGVVKTGENLLRYAPWWQWPRDVQEKISLSSQGVFYTLNQGGLPHQRCSAPHHYLGGNPNLEAKRAWLSHRMISG